MANYCKTKTAPHIYFECRAYIEDGENPLVIWQLRELNSEKRFNILPSMFTDHYEPCCPAEALGTLF